jgi:chromosome segregation protein
VEKVAELRDELARFGPVNEMAVEDFETKKARFDFLSRQRDDLVEARDGLLETIRKVNREARERFEATFAQAQENFKRVFEILFPGGEAELQLAGDDPLEADIVMAARPRGKKIESIKLLSSGERALTAIALLFAVYLIKPSPFCILDEVDAPLDDANIERFVALVRQFAEKTQFVIITHNKKTMEACDYLYGVTMEEPGVSKLVSVKLVGGDVVAEGAGAANAVAERASAANAAADADAG